MILAMIIIIISSIIYQKKDLPVKLFIEAQKNENDGHFEEAVISYESALQEAKKIRFQRSLESRIIDKLKVLHTAIEYRNNFRFAR
jgi:hypothetical protein